MSREIGERGNLLDTPELRAYYEDRKQLFRNLVLISASNIGWSVAFGLVGPLMTLRMLEMGWTEGYSATVNSINLWLVSFLVMYFSWKSDHTVTKIGRRKPYLFIAAGPIILSVALFPVCSSLISLVGLTLMKMLFGNLKNSTFPLLNIDCVPRALLARAQSILMVASGLIMFAVMRFAPNLIELGEWVPYAVATTLLLFSVGAAWFIKEPPIFNPAHAPFKPWSALQIGLRDRRIIWLMAGAAMLASFESVFASWTWIFAKTNLGLERGQIYHALSWAQLVSLALAFPTGWLIDKVGGLKVVVIYYLFMLVNLVLLLRVHDAPSLALYVAIMTAVNPLNSAADIMIFKTADPKEVGSVTSSSSFIRNFYNGSLLFMSGWFIHLTNRNYHMLFILAAVLMSVGLALIFVYAKKMSSRTESAPSEKSEPECGS